MSSAAQKSSDVQRRRRSSHESRKSLDDRNSHGNEGEKREDLVILRRKGSTDPGKSTTQREASEQTKFGQYKDCRASKVLSVSHDVMSGDPIRMMGNMEKRSKLIGWKKYWFVLDGHLLTYFKSKEDYENLSTFAGSITLGNVSIVRPIQIKHCKGFPMQIISRNQVYFLRCSEKSILEEWVLALQETISIPHKISSPVWTDPGAQFYRYSFAALSQWSIEDNPDDISGSLNNLPRNFYLKHEKSDKGKLNPSLKQKCQSFSSLPTRQSDLKSQSPLATSGMSSGSSSSLNVVSTRQGLDNSNTMRYSTSMFLLESSQQATELKRELASKLSIGQTAPSHIRGGKLEFSNHGKKKLKCIVEKSVDDGGELNIQCTNSVPSINDEGIYEDVDGDSWTGNAKSGSISQSSSLASIAEGFEPNLPRRTFHRTENKDGEYTTKKKGIGNFFQKIFKKESSENLGKKPKELVNISGPVDLRAQRIQNQMVDYIRTENPQTKVLNTNYTTHSLPSKSESASAIQQNHPSNEQCNPKIQKKVHDLVKPVPNAQALITELKNVQRKRSVPENEAEADDKILQVSVKGLNEPEHDAKNQYCAHETSSEPPLTSSYNEKLAKFNRLSAHLNPSFVAILNLTTPTSPMTRSSSCRVKSIHEENEPPLLPPKKSIPKSNPENFTSSSYDTPKNNRPVNPNASEICMSPVSVDVELAFVPAVLVQRERKISLRELLCKKNSAPEISFGKPDPESSEGESLSKFLCSDEEIVPPPRPPKNKSGSRTQSTTNAPEENDFQERDSESDLEVDKSMDIENLDVLSDYSDAASLGEEHIYSTVPRDIEPFGKNNFTLIQQELIQQDLDPIYGNIKHATIGTILTELETVEEFEDEEAELYDEFVLPMEPFKLPSESQAEIVLTESQHNSVFRHSGIDELQKYLNSEINSSTPDQDQLISNHDFNNRVTPALNRLGHSSAVKTLENLLQNNNV